MIPKEYNKLSGKRLTLFHNPIKNVIIGELTSYVTSTNPYAVPASNTSNFNAGWNTASYSPSLIPLEIRSTTLKMVWFIREHRSRTLLSKYLQF